MSENLDKKLLAVEDGHLKDECVKTIFKIK